MSDEELMRMGADPTDPLDRMFYGYNIPPGKSTTNWQCIDVIRDILGNEVVTFDEDNIAPGQIYVYNTTNKPIFVPTDEDSEFGGSIAIPNIHSRDAADVAVAAHEAYHAKLYKKVNGQLFMNEKLINKYASRWLHNHLSGFNLHAALEMITKSKLSYGDKMHVRR